MFHICYSFQEAIVKYGVSKMDIFQTNDLFEKKDMANVTNTILALGRAVSFLLCCSKHPLKIGFTHTHHSKDNVTNIFLALG